MTTIEKLQKQLEETKRSIKFANACEIVIDALNNKSDYEFTCPYTDRVTELFWSSDKFVEYAQFTFKLRSAKHFVEMYKISFNVKKIPLEYTKVINAIKFLLNNEDLIQIAFEINKENK